MSYWHIETTSVLATKHNRCKIPNKQIFRRAVPRHECCWSLAMQINVRVVWSPQQKSLNGDVLWAQKTKTAAPDAKECVPPNAERQNRWNQRSDETIDHDVKVYRVEQQMHETARASASTPQPKTDTPHNGGGYLTLPTITEKTKNPSISWHRTGRFKHNSPFQARAVAKISERCGVKSKAYSHASSGDAQHRAPLAPIRSLSHERFCKTST